MLFGIHVRMHLITESLTQESSCGSSGHWPTCRLIFTPHRTCSCSFHQYHFVAVIFEEHIGSKNWSEVLTDVGHLVLWNSWPTAITLTFAILCYTMLLCCYESDNVTKSSLPLICFTIVHQSNRATDHFHELFSFFISFLLTVLAVGVMWIFSILLHTILLLTHLFYLLLSKVGIGGP